MNTEPTPPHTLASDRSLWVNASGWSAADIHQKKIQIQRPDQPPFIVEASVEEHPSITHRFRVQISQQHTPIGYLDGTDLQRLEPIADAAPNAEYHFILPRD